MKIEIWSDFVCPSCYIGKRRLETAIEESPHYDKIFIEFKSYELDPGTEKDNEKNIHELLALRNSITIEQAREMNADVQKQAESVGLEYNFDTIQYSNTFDAHRLTAYAAKHCKGNEMTEHLFKAYFTDSKNISDHTTLMRLAKEVGLDQEEVKLILETCKYTNSVRLDQEQAKEIGIKSIPFFVFNEKYALSGVQSTHVFSEVIAKVWEEECNQSDDEFQVKKSNKTYCCDSEGCREID